MGSGVGEAACKTVVRQRLKRSGMRWRVAGGQAMLTCRALCHSERFERAWPLLVGTYQREGHLPQKVIALSGHRERVYRQYETYTHPELCGGVAPHEFLIR